MRLLFLFTSLYSSTLDLDGWLRRFKFDSLLRYLLRLIANVVLPVYFKWTRHNAGYRLMPRKNEQKVIVSLTSFPARINKVWIVVECMLRQTRKPDEIVLYLTESQFDIKNKLPKSLLSLEKRGLNIRFEKDKIRAHSKYFFAMRDFPKDIIITVDDDVFYNPYLIEYLVRNHGRYPSCSIATSARVLLIDQSSQEILPYRSWPLIKGEQEGEHVFGLGIGGVLYPPFILDHEYMNKMVFMDKCLYADDVWLYFMTRLAGHTCYKIDFPIMLVLPILIKSDIKLSAKNVEEDKNDVQIYSVNKYLIDKYNNKFRI